MTLSRQKAPRTRRCIKTSGLPSSVSNSGGGARKHLAPEGALRPQQDKGVSVLSNARKHLAPEGALRRVDDHCGLVPLFSARKHLAPEGALRHRNEKNPRPSVNSQKAPRTRRCIKTVGRPGSRPHWRPQKAPRTRRCIKTGDFHTSTNHT